jgi:hypothetical protein
MGKGLRIHTITGAEFDVYGPVTYKDFYDEGRVYYCAGQSWPASIVKQIL